MPPSRTSPPLPIGIRELADRARAEIGPHNQPIKHWIRLAEAARRAGHQALDSGNLAQAFIEFAKASIAVVEVLPQHRDYDTLLTAKQQESLDIHGQELLDSLAEVRAALRTRASSSSTSHRREPVRGGIVQRQQDLYPISHPRAAAEEIRAQKKADTLKPLVVPSPSIPSQQPYHYSEKRGAGVWSHPDEPVRMEAYAPAYWHQNAWSGRTSSDHDGFEDNRSWISPSPSPAASPMSGMRTPDSFSTGRSSYAKSVMSVSSMKTAMNQYIGRTFPLHPELVDVYHM
ncbi:hypothetical protein BV25DRAFT_1826779 [Artomyces pyxidatus]|uniref:Uncharacterized protein n=1 Tax=Artomyces pyxidatus TaxID=48021 RepID=A0ACB8SZC4_9AGAM|nr:hypothetical protein BV25DRAFT_1826779 [Artomyces pyxidatus]